MIQEFIDIYVENKKEIRAKITKDFTDYSDIVKFVIDNINEYSVESKYRLPCSELIHEIDDGDYQGTLVYVIGAHGYQPYKYWYVRVGYGSCSGCDALQAIHDYRGVLSEEAKDDYMLLILHIFEGLTKMGGECV